MRILISDSNDPFYNISLEEYLIKTMKEDDIFLLYINSSSVIIGKNQDPHSEVNIKYAKENEIDIVRRMSGGGAVYHDLGNLNYSFILQGKENEIYDFKKFSAPIVNALRKNKINVKFSGRNDLLVDGQKISGSAQFTHNGNLLHHGTILFNTDFSKINFILTPNKDKNKSKGVKSVKSRITNLCDHSSLKDMGSLIDIFKKEILGDELILNENQVYDVIKMSIDKRKEIDFILNLNESFENKSIKYIPGMGSIQINSNIIDGKISKIRIYGEYFSKGEVSDIEKYFIGVEYTEQAIFDAVDNLEDIDKYFHKLSKEKLRELIYDSK